MTHWQVCHQSGRVLFTTHNEVTARNREQFGWKVIEMDKSREQFEAEVFRRAEISGYKHPLSVLKKTSDGGYATTWVDMMWEGWQASRAALNIELTPVCWRTYYPDTYEETGRAHSESNERCARRIASEIGGYVVPVYHGNRQDCAAGIKVKE